MRLRTFRKKPAFPSGKRGYCDGDLSLSLLQCSYAEPRQLSLVKNKEPSGPKSILGVKWYSLAPSMHHSEIPAYPTQDPSRTLPASEVRLGGNGLDWMLFPPQGTLMSISGIVNIP